MMVDLVELELCVMYMADSSSEESSIQSQGKCTLSIQYVLYYANIVHIDVQINLRTPLSHTGDKHKLPPRKMRKKCYANSTSNREIMLI